MSFSHRNQTLWPIYITIQNLDTKTYQSQNNIKLISANCYKKRCYSILADFIVDYKERVLIIGIKTNMQYSICHI